MESPRCATVPAGGGRRMRARAWFSDCIGNAIREGSELLVGFADGSGQLFHRPRNLFRIDDGWWSEQNVISRNAVHTALHGIPGARVSELQQPLCWNIR